MLQHIGYFKLTLPKLHVQFAQYKIYYNFEKNTKSKKIYFDFVFYYTANDRLEWRFVLQEAKALQVLISQRKYVLDWVKYKTRSPLTLMAELKCSSVSSK